MLQWYLIHLLFQKQNWVLSKFLNKMERKTQMHVFENSLIKQKPCLIYATTKWSMASSTSVSDYWIADKKLGHVIFWYWFGRFFIVPNESKPSKLLYIPTMALLKHWPLYNTSSPCFFVQMTKGILGTDRKVESQTFLFFQRRLWNIIIYASLLKW